MSIYLDGKSLIHSLLPRVMLEGLQGEEEAKVAQPILADEHAMSATGLLIANIVLGAIKILQEGRYKSLDANPGDAGCQARALELRRLVGINLQEECSVLASSVSKIKVLMNNRRGSPKEQKKCAPLLFFYRHLGEVTISKEMEYILHCYLSTVLRTPYQKLENGVVMTRSEMSKLSILSSKITVLESALRRKIVEENQKTLSILSVEAMHSAATQVTSLASEEKQLMVTMLSHENTHLFTPDRKYEPKAFGCLFYEVKTLLIRLREGQALICLKSIVPEGCQGFHLFLQPQIPGGEFAIVPDEAYMSFGPKTAIIVFDAVITVEKKVAAELLMEHGFTNVMLMESSKEAPYEPTSTIADVQVAEAVEEISAYKKRSAVLGNVFTLDHVYLNTVGAELKK